MDMNVRYWDDDNGLVKLNYAMEWVGMGLGYP